MGRKPKRIAFWTLIGLNAVLAIGLLLSWTTIQRIFLGGVKIYETVPPNIPVRMERPAILIFSKTNGFRHEDAIPAANRLFAQIARSQGWGYFQTENGAAFSPEILSRFDLVVFNNVSGDVFTPAQRSALRKFIEDGKGFVGVHGSGGDLSYNWAWYADHLIGARFVGHTLSPQFQQATVHVENDSHPATARLRRAWQRTDEWYSFNRSPRAKGYRILLTIDEGTYDTEALFGQNLAMGKDHPIAWSHCVGKGRAFYSAMGHRAEAYAEPEYQAMLLGAIRWGLRLQGDGCGSGHFDAAADNDGG